jgi:hypothetical protein
MRPPGRLFAQDKIKSPTIRKDIVPGDPRLVPSLAVDLQALYVDLVHLITATTSYKQLLATSKIDAEPLEPWTANEKGSLACQWVQPNHVPQNPRLHGVGVTVTWYASCTSVIEALGCVARVLDTQVLSANEVKEVRCGCGGLVAWSEDRAAVSGIAIICARLEKLF